MAGCFLFFAFEVKALGVSPPWVRNYELLRGSHFEKIVHINQGAPQEPLIAEVEVDAAGFEHWITVKPGLKFTVPVVQLFPVTVVVDVPEDAELGSYRGELKIITSPAPKEGEGGARVTIGIGAAVALDLEVVEKKIIDWAIPLWDIKPLEEGWPVKVALVINNKGNTRVRPLKVVLDIYNEERSSKIGSVEVSEIDYVEAFERREVVVEFPIDLEPAFYYAKVYVYKNENDVLELESLFEVLEKGALPVWSEAWFRWLVAAIIALVIFLGLIFALRRKIWAFLKATGRFFVRTRRKSKKIVQVLREKEE